LPRYRRPHRIRRLAVVGLTAGAALGVACGGSKDDGPSADDWLQTDGANGRINLDDVRDAYHDSFDDNGFQAQKFEQRVNEIYEGDHIVVVKVDKAGDEVNISGWEDLNDNKTIDDTTDDLLFTINHPLQNGAAYTVNGAGANSYYHESSPFNSFLPGFFLGQLLSGGRTTYITAPARYDELSSYRTSYRSGSGYTSQQGRNKTYGGSVSSRFGSSATTRTASPARTSYQQRQVSSGGFKSSPSSGRSISSGGKSGPIKGGGGLMA
jgi:hypothetical protein